MKPELEETQEIGENYFQEDLKLTPHRVRRLWVNNFFSRTIAFLTARDPDRRHIFLRATADGRLRVSAEPAGITTAYHGQVTVGTTATLIRPTNLLRLDIVIVNDSGIKLFLGFTNAVTTTNGFPIRDGCSWGSDTYKGPLWAIVATGTATVGVIEI